VARQRADPELVAVAPDIGELVEVVDVDQVLGRRQSQLHHRDQAVAAGDDPRGRAELDERRDRPVDAGGAFIPTGCGRLH
jgi:hypothetical protein